MRLVRQWQSGGRVVRDPSDVPARARLEWRIDLVSALSQTAVSPSQAPVVSVMIMVYNHERYLEEAVSSVLEQGTDYPFEILLGEDCSSDQSRKIVFDLEHRHPGIVRVVTSDTNVGAFQNARRLIAAARGDFIAYLDGDDFWMPGKLDRQVEALRSNPHCSAVYANAKVVDREGSETGQFNDVGDVEITASELLCSGNILHTSSMMFRAPLKKFILALEHQFIDFQLHLELAKHGNLLHLAQPLSAYRLSSESSMVATENTKVRELYWQALLEARNGDVGNYVYARAVADFLRRVLFRAIATRQPSLYLMWWRRAVSVAPCTPWRLGLLTGCRFLRISWIIVRDWLRRLCRRGRGVERVLYHR